MQLLQRRRSGVTPRPSGGDFNKALLDLVSAGARWGQVSQFYRDMREAGVRPEAATLKAIIPAAVQAHQAADAVELMGVLRSEHGPPGVGFTCGVISSLLRQGRHRGTPCREAAYTLWRQLVEGREKSQKLDAVAYRIGMNVCVDTGRLDEAQRILDVMRAAGLSPGWASYHILMKYHARRGDMDAARRLFVQLRSYLGGRVPEISAYNTLLAGFVRLGELTMARAVLDKAKREGAGPDAYTYSTFAAGLAAAGRLDEAEELLSEAEAAGVTLNVYVYCAVLNGIVRQGDVPRAEQLLARARAAGVRPTVAMYNILIRGCAFGGRGAAAAADAGAAVESLMAEMRAAGLRPNAVTYGTLVQAAVRDGNIDAALGVLSAMRVDGVSPDGAVFTSLMKLFRTQGYHAQALEFFQQLAASRTATLDVMALNCLAAVHAAAGQTEEAEQAVARAGQLAAMQGMPPPPEATYALVQGYGRLRRLAPALTAFRRFLASGGRPHRKLCEYVYRLCLSQHDFRAAGQVLRAMRLMPRLHTREREPLYRQWWEEAQRRAQMRRSPPGSSGSMVSGEYSSGEGPRGSPGEGPRPDINGSSSSGSGDWGAEKLKWWFGLPNRYYDSSWK